MGFGFAGAGAGASKALEEILGEQMLRAKMQQNEQQAQAEMELKRQQLAESARQADVDSGQRQQQIDMQAGDRRQRTNVQGIRRMLGESITQRTGPMTSDDRRGMAALQVEAGDDPTILNEPQKKMRSVTTIGPNGRPLNRMVPEDEAVEEYREPKSGPAPEKPAYIQVTGPDGRLQMMTAEEIRAQGGVATTKGNAPDPAKATETRGKILEAAKALKTAPGLSSLTGNRIGNTDYNLGFSDEPRGGSSAANAQPLYNTLKSLLTLDNLSLLKGAMSDKDLQFLQSAGSSLDTKMDDPTFVAELDKIIQKFEPQVGNVPPPPGGGGNVALMFNPVTGKLEPVRK